MGQGERHVARYDGLPKFARFSPDEDIHQAWAHVPTHEELSRQQGDLILSNFVRRLEFNSGRTAPKLRRYFIKHNRPARPPGGYNLLVTRINVRKKLPPTGTVLNSAAKAAISSSFVSRPDGKQRPLKNHEAEALRRQNTQRPAFAHRRLVM